MFAAGWRGDGEGLPGDHNVEDREHEKDDAENDGQVEHEPFNPPADMVTTASKVATSQPSQACPPALEEDHYDERDRYDNKRQIEINFHEYSPIPSGRSDYSKRAGGDQGNALPASLYGLPDMLLQIGFDEGVQFTVKDGLGVAQFKVGSVVLHQLVGMHHVGPYLAAPFCLDVVTLDLC